MCGIAHLLAPQRQFGLGRRWSREYDSSCHHGGVHEPQAVFGVRLARRCQDRRLQFHQPYSLQREEAGDRVHLGITADAFPVIAEIEKMLGAQFPRFSWPMKSAEGSLIARSWREALFCETTSLRSWLAQPCPVHTRGNRTSGGERSYACVPRWAARETTACFSSRRRGISRSTATREVLLRYARRIGEILENDLMGQSQTLFDHLPDDEPDSLLFDAQASCAAMARAAVRRLSGSCARAIWRAPSARTPAPFSRDRSRSVSAALI